MITSKLPNVGITIFTQMSQLAASSGALNLSQGFPDFDGPQALRDALGWHVANGHNQYCPMTGLPALRQQVAAKIARSHHLHAPSLEQPQYNLLHRARVELEYAPLYSELGLGTTIWSPLASGLLTGKYNEGVPDDARLGQKDNAWLQKKVLGEEGRRRLDRVRRFTTLAAELGEKPSQLAIAWCLRNPHVSTVMLGASRTTQLLENLGALELAGRYDDGVWARLAAATAE